MSHTYTGESRLALFAVNTTVGAGSQPEEGNVGHAGQSAVGMRHGSDVVHEHVHEPVRHSLPLYTYDAYSARFTEYVSLLPGVLSMRRSISRHTETAS